MEVPNIKLEGNPSSGNRDDTCGQTDRRMDVTKLTSAFRDYANMPKNPEDIYYVIS